MSENQEKVYLVQHVTDDDSPAKIIGIYSSMDQARFAVRRLVSKSGFAEHAEGFHIDPYPINKDHWIDGFQSSKRD